MLRRNRLSLAAIAVLLGGVIGVSGPALAQDADSGPEVERAITQAIESVDDARVEGLQVYVEPNGTLTVHGMVASNELEDRILEIARRHSNGEPVHDRIVVVNKGERITGR
ncbi:hypothetical protein H0Z60_00670 [Ectothiorhodospiraceae bacterium WFHF3C12]|nr:hypothetical protein [Ectothiorhodospiraceae bacterium WFHF3C12]